ncbi:MAG TPA: glycosyltransferase [Candidatus Gracilibacteria bacterium]|nr:glycosyltransferase [Candidatus Gracilibacteria bacterium]
MLSFQKTSIYSETLKQVSDLLQLTGKNTSNPLLVQLRKDSASIVRNLAKALCNINNPAEFQQYNNLIKETIFSSLALIDLGVKHGEVTTHQAEKMQKVLESIKHQIKAFPASRKKILVLSSIMGQGHMSASKAIKQGLEHQFGLDYDIEIIDFFGMLNSFVNKVTQKTYEGSTKFVPQIYKFIFDSTDAKWQIKLINQINYPFVLNKVKKFFAEKDPALVISTFPIWNYLTAEIWKKVKPNSKFLTIVTDSISIHTAWTIANTDFHIVANEDTAMSLRKLGVPQDKIKILGFPVRLEFLNDYNRNDFISKQGLDPKNFTILFLPTAQGAKMNVKTLKELMDIPDTNVIVITGRDEKLKPKFEKYVQNKNTIKLIGWTDQMPAYLKTCDLVITKAGGATVMECVACQKPMIITSIIPGQE